MAIRNGKLPDYIIQLIKGLINIIKENQYIEMKWNPANVDYYKDKGYVFSKYKDVFMVDVNDLKPSTQRKIIAICDYCGKEYETVYASYCNSINKNGKCACKNCGGKKHVELTLKERQETMYDYITKTCREMNYELLTTEEELIDSHSLVFFKCPIHGLQHKTYYNFTNHKMCRKCSYKEINKNNKLTQEELINGINSINNNIIINPEEYIDVREKNLKIICGCCGNEYTTSWNSYTKGTIRCRKCTQNESKSEFKIRKILEENNVNYIQQHRFDDCRDKYPLPFDFYLPDTNECIEYDGEQHYIIWHSEEEFNEVKRRDKIKDEYCKEHNIKLIRIPYWEKKNLEETLKNNNIIR